VVIGEWADGCSLLSKSVHGSIFFQSGARFLSTKDAAWMHDGVVHTGWLCH
jgi:hypothetical protein